MIFPVRCFTCGHLIGTKWDQYNTLMDKKNKNQKEDTLTSYNMDKIKDNIQVFNKIGISRYCCKRHFTTHVDLH